MVVVVVATVVVVVLKSMLFDVCEGMGVAPVEGVEVIVNNGQVQQAELIKENNKEWSFL